VSALVSIRGLVKSFPVRRGLLRRTVGHVHAVQGVDLDLAPGESFALVGESGSGKTTLARCLVRLLEPTGGSVEFQGEDLLALAPADLRRRRRHFQIIFQDPYGSLNPRMRVERILAEPLEVHRTVAVADRRKRVLELLDLVGLPAEAAKRYPHEFSGGQRQRIGIARALATEPELLIADEPVSALDVSVRAQVINLIADLQQRRGLTLVLIAHDLAVVEQITDRCGVLYMGRLVEVGPTAELFAKPEHPYTVSLLSAVPVPDPGRTAERIVLSGEPPSPLDPPGGCPFHPRCPIARERCATDEPPLAERGDGRRVACHYPGELESASGSKQHDSGTFSPEGRRIH
jgi:oligopeptide/dipeptide ABC transporter ATP-binding protein